MPTASKSTFQLDRYDAEAIARYYRGKPLQVWWRCLAIFLPMLWLFLKLRWDKRTGQVAQKGKQRAAQLRKLLTRLGPAFIKIGQALSTRPDIVPPVYMDELAQLQDHLPAFPNEIAFQFIREELGGDPHEVYAEISDNPIAAASLGQVYKGRLHTGEQVAIKVQRPDIVAGIALDMYILRGISAWMMKSFKFIRSNLVGILEEFAFRIFEEMDYTHEGENAEKFAKYYGHGQIDEIYVPCIYWKYTAKRVLTMEWIEGIKLTDIEGVKASGFDSRHIIEVGVQCSLRQLLDYGFFHADPHPGNLLVMTDGKLAYLDFGMMSSVSAEQRFGLIEAIVHLVNRDFDALSKDYVRLGFLSSDVNFEGIVPALAEVFNPPPGKSLTEMDFKGMTDKLSQIMYDYPFQVPAYYALIIRSLVTLEGIALSVDRNFKVLAVAYPYVANRLLTDRSPELRMALKDVLFRDGSFRWNRLENLLSNAQTNQDYSLKQTVDQVSDFLLSERGEFMRDRLVDELVKGIEETALKRIPNPFSKDKPKAKSSETEESGLDHAANIWSILQKDQKIDPLEFLPLAGKILLKPETQAVGRNIISQLAQRAMTRVIREIALRGTSVSEPQVAIPQPSESSSNASKSVEVETLPKSPSSGSSSAAYGSFNTAPNVNQKPLSKEPVALVSSPSSSSSPMRRQVNGRSW
ncbi:AarF/ABC1/UbiB kinase family protein [Tumidithrix elongata RA019]|uniref:AarF/ABC1/UbiB kinase family protein n=2 Tax=Tumidithrix TaxID=3088355 RepID=A0AAW9Q1X4_9CYAN|nr:AarF/ABC1/UbiB kinase family protein [Tumidithrix elongata RA019]